MKNLNLFALTNDATKRILRFSLSSDVQNEMSQVFTEQEKSFKSYAQHEYFFDGKYKPDDGECLVIDDYDDLDNIHDVIANPLSVPEISPDPTEFATIKALFTGHTDSSGAKIALIQSFDRKKIISTSGLSIFYSNNVYKRVDGVGVTIDTKLAVLMSGKTLKFFSFHVVRQIFDLSSYYIEATDSDISDFAKSEAVHVVDTKKLIDLSDSWIRRKLALINQSGILRTVPAKHIQAAATGFSIDLKIDVVDGKEVIVLPQEKSELKKILRFLDDDYYKSPLSSKNFVSNSKRPA